MCLVAVAAIAGSAQAQPALDTRLGPDATGHPIVLRGNMLSHAVGALAHAGGIPIGWEYRKLPARPDRSITLTGLSIRDALDILARESGCQWREIAGVIVCRPASVWDDAASPLAAGAPSVSFLNTTGNRALSLVAILLGAPPETAPLFSDTRRFRLKTDGGTVFDLLNAIVRERGDMVWLLEHQPRTARDFPYIVSLMSGSAGGGLGVTGYRVVESLDLSRFEAPEPDADAAAPVLARIVGPAADGRPVVVHGPYYWSIQQLAAATGTPFGFESGPPGPPSMRGEYVATGRPLGEALATIVALDPRYEWREMNGVIVVRPAAAWSDARSALFALAPRVRLDDAPTVEAVTAVAVALGRDPRDLIAFPDGRRISLDVHNGTMLDLLNAIVRAHGELFWTYTPADKDDAKRTGLGHTLLFGIFTGVGTGVLVR
jgi:hypothetical protein